jgi:hypothetical protein
VLFDFGATVAPTEVRATVELRGGFAWDNRQYLFTASPHSDPGSSILICGSAEQRGVEGSIHIPNGYCTILNAALLEDEAVIQVQSGIGLDPLQGRVIQYGPAE